jgi:hypothetical protein
MISTRYYQGQDSRLTAIMCGESITTSKKHCSSIIRMAMISLGASDESGRYESRGRFRIFCVFTRVSVLQQCVDKTTSVSVSLSLCLSVSLSLCLSVSLSLCLSISLSLCLSVSLSLYITDMQTIYRLVTHVRHIFTFATLYTLHA